MSQSKLFTALRKSALGYPGTQEGIACQGTSLERITFKVRNKAFLFLGATDAMVKLGALLAEAVSLAGKEPDRYRPGGHGWVKVIFASDDDLPLDLLARWLDESFRLLAPKTLVASLPAGGASTGGPEAAGKKGALKSRAPARSAKKKASRR